ncbi:MAG: glycosyltransferase family 39 protein [Bacteroidota bacterium]
MWNPDSRIILKPSPINYPILWTLLGLKALLHILAIANGYGIHRDEFLYLAMGDHPMFGYLECSPMIGWIAGMFTTIFGSSVLAAKLPVLLIGLLSIWILLRLVTELGGSKQAQWLAGLGWVLSPAFLGSNNLFQPVSFNQFCWLLLAFTTVRLIKYQRRVDYLWLGAALGIGILTKYSILFYAAALITGLLISPQRKILWSKNMLLAGGMALIIALPNIIWQFANSFPVLNHMRLLSESQLVNVGTADFFIPQFLFHFMGATLWLPGLFYLFRSSKLRDFRCLAWSLLFTLLILYLLSGKAYYTIGAYSALFAAGGIFWESKLKQRGWYLSPLFLLNFSVIPYGLPMLPIAQMQAYGIYMRDNWGMDAQLRWEDGSIRDLSQDYADMHGWEEMVAEVADFYHQLSPEQQARTMIYAANYGQAGALTFYQNKYNLPQAYCFDSSFLLWVDTQLQFEHQLAVETELIPESNYFGSIEFIGNPETEYARQQHYIYYRTEPLMPLQPEWERIYYEVLEPWMGE